MALTLVPRSKHMEVGWVGARVRSSQRGRSHLQAATGFRCQGQVNPRVTRPTHSQAECSCLFTSPPPLPSPDSVQAYKAHAWVLAGWREVFLDMLAGRLRHCLASLGREMAAMCHLPTADASGGESSRSRSPSPTRALRLVSTVDGGGVPFAVPRAGASLAGALSPPPDSLLLLLAGVCAALAEGGLAGVAKQLRALATTEGGGAQVVSPRLTRDLARRARACGFGRGTAMGGLVGARAHLSVCTPRTPASACPPRPPRRDVVGVRARLMEGYVQAHSARLELAAHSMTEAGGWRTGKEPRGPRELCVLLLDTLAGACFLPLVTGVHVQPCASDPLPARPVRSAIVVVQGTPLLA